MTPSATPTTEQAFGEKLHTYTIVDAIRDGNVLPFRIDYIQTIRKRDEFPDEKVYDIYRKGAYQAAERVDNVVGYILDHYAQKTKRQHGYKLKGKRVMGFNSLFATASIDAAKLYYSAFKRIQAERGGEQLKVALIYSFGPNEADDECGLPDESFDVASLDAPSRDFLDAAIADYNALFSTSYSTDGDKFQSYYKDLSERMKKREVDLVIVVNMFLTGFDATTLNTLWVDKDLRDHGLIQAFSRTNRILNSVKDFGSVYRDLYEQYRPKGHDAAIINDDLVFEVELLKSVDINIDYILMLARKYHDGNCRDKTIVADIERAIGSSWDLRNKRDLIERFVEGLEATDDVDSDWREYVEGAKRSELAAIVKEESLRPEETQAFVEHAFADGGVTETGTAVVALMTRKPSRFAPANAYAEMKSRVVERLKAYVDRFLGLGV